MARWIQKANRSIKRRGTKGVCTGTKFGGPTCRPGTRRYMVGRNIEEPQKSHQMGSGKWQMTQGVQEWLTPEPLNGPDLEAWLTDYENSH